MSLFELDGAILLGCFKRCVYRVGVYLREYVYCDDFVRRRFEISPKFL